MHNVICNKLHVWSAIKYIISPKDVYCPDISREDQLGNFVFFLHSWLAPSHILTLQGYHWHLKNIYLVTVESIHFSVTCFLLFQRQNQLPGEERFSATKLISSKGASELPEIRPILEHAKVCMKFLCFSRPWTISQITLYLRSCSQCLTTELGRSREDGSMPFTERAVRFLLKFVVSQVNSQFKNITLILT